MPPEVRPCTSGVLPGEKSAEGMEGHWEEYAAGVSHVANGATPRRAAETTSITVNHGNWRPTLWFQSPFQRFPRSLPTPGHITTHTIFTRGGNHVSTSHYTRTVPEYCFTYCFTCWLIYTHRTRSVRQIPPDITSRGLIQAYFGRRNWRRRRRSP
jgi:hypothetical protein